MYHAGELCMCGKSLHLPNFCKPKSSLKIAALNFKIIRLHTYLR